MLLKDLFAPRWKHSNPKERILGLQEIRNPEHYFEVILKDSDVKVVEEALSFCRNQDGYLRLRPHLDNHPFAATIEKFYSDLFIEMLLQKEPDAAQLSSALPLLELIRDDEQLLRLYRRSETRTLREQCLRTLKSSKQIYRLLKDHEVPEEIEILMEKLEDTSLLKKLYQSAKSKRVRRVAQVRLEQRSISVEASLTTAQIRQKLEELVSQLQFFRREKEWKQGIDAVPALRARWNQIDENGKHPLRESFDQLAQLMVENERRYHDVQARLHELLSVRDYALAHEGFKRIDTSVLKSQEVKDWEERIFEIFRTAQVQKQVQQEDGRQQRDEERKQQKLERLLDDLRRLSSDWFKKKVSLKAGSERLALLAESWQHHYYETTTTAAWQTEFLQLREDLAAAIEVAKQQWQVKKEEEDRRLERAKTIVAEIELTLTPQGDKHRLLRPLQDEFEKIRSECELDRSLVKRYKEAVDAFYHQLKQQKEERSWEEWASYHRRKELCVMARELTQNLEQEGLGEMALQLQQEWRMAGRTPRDQFGEIHAEFKNLCDLIFNHCLEKKKAIVERLRVCIKDLEEGQEVNFKEIADRVHQLSDEFKNVGQIPYALEKEEVKKFNQLKSYFFKKREAYYEERDKERESNLALKMRIVEESDRLVREPYAKNIKLEKFQELQRRWKALGPIPKTCEVDPWASFKANCDTFFSSLQEERDELVTQKQTLSTQLEALLAPLEQFSLDQFEEAQKQVQELQERWEEIPLSHRELDGAFHQRCRHFFEIRGRKVDELKKAEAALRRQKEKLLVQAECEYSTFAYDEALTRLDGIKMSFDGIVLQDEREQQRLCERFSKVVRTLELEYSSFKESATESIDPREHKECLATLAVILKLLNPDQAVPGLEELSPAEQISLGMRMKGLIMGATVEKGEERVAKSFQNAQVQVAKIQERWCRLPPLAMAQGKEEFWRNYKALLAQFYTP